MSGSLVVETLHFADRSIVNLADCFLRTNVPTVTNPLTDQTVPENATCSSDGYIYRESFIAVDAQVPGASPRFNLPHPYRSR